MKINFCHSALRILLRINFHWWTSFL